MTMMALLLLEAGATAKKPHWKNSCNGNKCLSYYVTFVQLFSCSAVRGFGRDIPRSPAPPWRSWWCRRSGRRRPRSGGVRRSYRGAESADRAMRESRWEKEIRGDRNEKKRCRDPVDIEDGEELLRFRHIEKMIGVDRRGALDPVLLQALPRRQIDCRGLAAGELPSGAHLRPYCRSNSPWPEAPRVTSPSARATPFTGSS